MNKQFPTSFVWGAATAAYQIEGAADADGKGPSVWDMMCRWEGKIFEGHTGAVACDHYNRVDEDVRLMKSIGLQAYRFSFSWPRILPEGTGAVNEQGLAFYDRLIDTLLANGIEPWATLFHWDFPLELYYKGGWLNRDSHRWFGEYTQIVVDRFSDRVTKWMTLNEPQCFVGRGHDVGVHAPGLQLPVCELLRAAHHALMAHGIAVQVLRSRCNKPPTIGWAPVGAARYPVDADNPHDVEAARRSMYSVSGKNLWNMTWFSDPVCLGHYPEDGLELFGSDAPRTQPGDMELICQPLDFYGANIYSARPIKAGPDGEPIELMTRAPGHPMTLFCWPVEPASLYWGPRYICERYKLPLVITENGISMADWVTQEGQVHDYQRIDYTRRYLQQLHRAISDGVDVRGYFHWSLMDNFEWAEGYRQRFGLVHVDYSTQKRTIKDSGYWYRKVIETNGGAVFDNTAAEMMSERFCAEHKGGN